MYYGPEGEVLKKFNTRDGMGFQLLREKGIKTALVTSEDNPYVAARGRKLKVDHVIQGRSFGGKVEAVREICLREGISLSEVAYIGDDINCLELLREVGFAACPSDADPLVKAIPCIYISPLKGGEGCVRDFIRKILGF
jgi:N-acylneuraminate cytidylyltransferase